MVTKSEELQAQINKKKAEMDVRRKAFEEQHKKSKESIFKAGNSVEKDGVFGENNTVKSDDFVEKIKNSKKEPIVFDEATQYAAWTPEDAEPKKLSPEKLKELNDAIEVSTKLNEKLKKEVSKKKSVDEPKNEIERKKEAKKIELTDEYKEKVKERTKEFKDAYKGLKDELEQELKDNFDDYSPSDIREARETKEEELQELKKEFKEDLETLKEEFEEELEEALDDIDDGDDSYSRNATDITISDLNFNPSRILKAAIAFIGVGITIIVGLQVYNAMSEVISMEQSLATNVTAASDVLASFPIGMMFILLIGPIALFQLIKIFDRGRIL